jgi:gluconokinase
MAPDLVLALDMGTSSVRAMVLPDGRPGPVTRRTVTVDMDDAGAGTVDGRAYQGALVECLDELDASGALDGVNLVATSAQWHSVVPADAHGEPLGPVLTWFDTRAVPAPGAPGPADPDGFHQRTGAWWHRMYWTMRLPWLRAHLGAGAARFLGLPELVLSGLLDDPPMSVSMASGTGMLDLAGLRWDEEAAALAQVRPGELPDLAPAGWRGRLLPAYARRWPALRDAVWTPPIGDGAASNFGAGCRDERRAAVTVGTSAAVRLVQDCPPGAPLPWLPQSLWRYRVDHDRVVTGAAYSAGGNLFKWARSVLRLPDGPELEESLDRVEPGAGVWADPRLAGDRPPGIAPPGAGELRGLGITTTAVQIWAGLMDGVCRLVARDLAELEATRTIGGGEPAEVVLAGRAVATSAWWRRAFRAALAPRAVSDLAEPEVGALGAALVALSSR